MHTCSTPIIGLPATRTHAAADILLLVLLLTISALTAAAAHSIINGMECPSDELTVPAGADLGSQPLNVDDRTFRLAGGASYSMQMGAIVVRQGSRRCYVGATTTGPNPTRITPQLGGADNETRAAFQSYGVLGLAHMPAAQHTVAVCWSGCCPAGCAQRSRGTVPIILADLLLSTLLPCAGHFCFVDIWVAA